MNKAPCELLGRTIMVNPCLSILGNNISHHTCFPCKCCHSPYQQIDYVLYVCPLLMSFGAGLAFKALTNKAW